MAKLFITDDPRTTEITKTISELYPAIDPVNMQTYLMIRKLSTELESSLDNFFGLYGLSAGRFLLMLLMKSNSEGLMPTELSNMVGVTQATISGLIGSLEKAGLVTREVHKKDGRAFVIKLTDKGNQLLETISPTFFSRVNEFLAVVSNQDKEAIINSLATLITQVKVINKSISE